MIPRYLKILALMMIVAESVISDSWILPTTRVAFSDNRQYCMLIVPGDQPFNPTVIPDSVHLELPSDLKPHSDAFGILFVRNSDSTYGLVWQALLPYSTSPSDVMIQNEGRWVVMIDEWASHGLGDYVVVIFDDEGRMVSNFSLNDLYPGVHFPRSSSSLWWRGPAKFIDTLDQLEIRSRSNRDLSAFSDLAIFEDYLRIDLRTGEIVSFASKYDEILSTYSKPCLRNDGCYTMRYFYYLMYHPDSTVLSRFDSLRFAGNVLDTLRLVYEKFGTQPFWEIGAAYKLLGRDVYFGISGYVLDEPVIFVDSKEIEEVPAFTDSFPVIVRLPGNEEFFPLVPYASSFAEARLRGGGRMFAAEFDVISDSLGLRFPYSNCILASIVTPDSTIMKSTKVGVLSLSFGTRIRIDMSK